MWIIHILVCLKLDFHVYENFFQIKLSKKLYEKIPSFVCFLSKIENKWILKLQNLFSSKTGWFKNELYQAVTFCIHDYL